MNFEDLIIDIGNFPKLIVDETEDDCDIEKKFPNIVLLSGISDILYDDESDKINKLRDEVMKGFTEDDLGEGTVDSIVSWINTIICNHKETLIEIVELEGHESMSSTLIEYLEAINLDELENELKEAFGYMTAGSETFIDFYREYVTSLEDITSDNFDVDYDTSDVDDIFKVRDEDEDEPYEEDDNNDNDERDIKIDDEIQYDTKMIESIGKYHKSLKNELPSKPKDIKKKLKEYIEALIITVNDKESKLLKAKKCIDIGSKSFKDSLYQQLEGYGSTIGSREFNIKYVTLILNRLLNELDEVIEYTACKVVKDDGKRDVLKVIYQIVSDFANETINGYRSRSALQIFRLLCRNEKVYNTLLEFKNCISKDFKIKKKSVEYRLNTDASMDVTFKTAYILATGSTKGYDVKYTDNIEKTIFRLGKNILENKKLSGMYEDFISTKPTAISIKVLMMYNKTHELFQENSSKEYKVGMCALLLSYNVIQSQHLEYFIKRNIL